MRRHVLKRPCSQRLLVDFFNNLCHPVMSWSGMLCSLGHFVSFQHTAVSLGGVSDALMELHRCSAGFFHSHRFVGGSPCGWSQICILTTWKLNGSMRGFRFVVVLVGRCRKPELENIAAGLPHGGWLWQAKSRILAHSRGAALPHTCTGPYAEGGCLIWAE